MQLLAWGRIDQGGAYLPRREPVPRTLESGNHGSSTTPPTSILGQVPPHQRGARRQRETGSGSGVGGIHHICSQGPPPCSCRSSAPLKSSPNPVSPVPYDAKAGGAW